MSESVVPNFDGLEKPQLSNRVRTAGIYTACTVKGDIEYVEEKVKNEGKPDEKLISEHVIVTLNVPTDEGLLEYSQYIFAPPANPSDVKLFDKVYNNNVAIRDYTAEEQIEADWYYRRNFFSQLCFAAGIPFEKIKDSLQSVKSMLLLAATVNKLLKTAKTPFDAKIIWINSEKSRKSTLSIQLPKFRNSVVFWPTEIITDSATGKKTVGKTRLHWSDYERANNMVAKFSNSSTPPRTDSSVASAANEPAPASAPSDDLMF